MTLLGDALLSVRRRDWASVSGDEGRSIESIWAEAFPPAERGTHDTVSRRNSTWLWTADLDGELVGFATALALPTSGAAYLEYLAVSSSTRGLGVGAALLDVIAEDVRDDVRGIVLEVEDPVRTPGRDPLLARRVGFYARWGAWPVGLLDGYSMPDLASPGELVPMVLLWRGDEELDADGVARVLADLYEGYYAGLAPDGHLDAMLRRVDGLRR
ncbi:GNAT family N-acetyltransferase [Saccharothrix variisporea]|uniref:Acetyltransferase (GNAT) family protein n=1 Tax=Saccharothrix variisporea TaxID=543527 RepID=A0A495X3I3_9PSEU|nr:GNAT family N-acetyltransferase [Saccharothrix variisporea]RKT67734.1 acetyltransferase (GNAT) family protein [Saccharothrix variisporea]